MPPRFLKNHCVDARFYLVVGYSYQFESTFIHGFLLIFCWRKDPARCRFGTGTEIMLDPRQIQQSGVYMTAYWPGGYSLHVTVAVQRKGILAFARESAGEELAACGAS